MLLLLLLIINYYELTILLLDSNRCDDNNNNTERKKVERVLYSFSLSPFDMKYPGVAKLLTLSTPSKQGHQDILLIYTHLNRFTEILWQYPHQKSTY